MTFFFLQKSLTPKKIMIKILIEFYIMLILYLISDHLLIARSRASTGCSKSCSVILKKSITNMLEMNMDLFECFKNHKLTWRELHTFLTSLWIYFLLLLLLLCACTIYFMTKLIRGNALNFLRKSRVFFTLKAVIMFYAALFSLKESVRNWVAKQLAFADFHYLNANFLLLIK